MRSQALWIWSLILLAGCEAKFQANINSTPIISKSGSEYVELKSSKITMKVKVLSTLPPTTVALMKDEDEQVSYSSITVHDCESRSSILKHLTVYDDKLNVLSAADMDAHLDVEHGSLSEAELELACSKGTNA